MCDMTHSYVCRDSFWRVFFIRVICFFGFCDMTHSFCAFTFEKQPSFARAISARGITCTNVCDMTRSYVWRALLDSVKWLIISVLSPWKNSLLSRVQYARAASRAHICATWLVHVCDTTRLLSYEVATISRLLKIPGLFCKRALQKRLYSANETYNLKEPINRSHPIRTTWLILTALPLQNSRHLLRFDVMPRACITYNFYLQNLLCSHFVWSI